MLYSTQPPRYFQSLINRPWPSPSPTPTPEPTPKPTPGTLPPATPAIQGSSISSPGISEASLFQALVQYRQTHSRNSIVQEESLCVYARKRVSEHQSRLKSLGEGESPLDNHSGFNRDAESGSVFSDTGFKSVAEVLAYLPQAQTAIQVLEWGWDSSPAHREGLLNNASTHACITGTAPFYVGILANH